MVLIGTLSNWYRGILSASDTLVSETTGTVVRALNLRIPFRAYGRVQPITVINLPRTLKAESTSTSDTPKPCLANGLRTVAQALRKELANRESPRIRGTVFWCP